MSRSVASLVRAEAERLGADLLDNSSHGELHVNIWLPAGKNWVSSDGHSLSADYFSDPAAGWSALLADMQLGVVDCTDLLCDACFEG